MAITKIQPIDLSKLYNSYILHDSTNRFGSFLHFLQEYVYISDPPPEGQGCIKWQPWPYLIDFVKDLLANRLLVILKARQLGFSWVIAAYALWTAITKPYSLVLLYSIGQSEARELLRKVKYIYSQLPVDIRPELTRDNTEELSFSSLNSGIMAFPSTDTAGSGFTGTLVITDENAKHPNAITNYSAFEPTINAGGQHISLSSANGIGGVGGHFHNLYTKAKAGLNGYKHSFYGALLRPGRDMAWYEKTKLAYASTPHLFYQEYPLNDDEAFILTTGIRVFDSDALFNLKASQRLPMEITRDDLGYTAMWVKPIVGHRYCAGVDVSYGLDTPDESWTNIEDIQSGIVVACIKGHYTPEMIAEKSVDLFKQYNRAFYGLEIEGVGRFAYRKFEELGYTAPDVCYHQDWEQAQEKHIIPTKAGWSTNGTTRGNIIPNLSEALRTGSYVTYNEDEISEMYTFVHLNNKPQAAVGCHDDGVMSAAICNEMRSLPFLRYNRPTKPVPPSVYTRKY